MKRINKQFNDKDFFNQISNIHFEFRMMRNCPQDRLSLSSAFGKRMKDAGSSWHKEFNIL